MTDTLTPEKRSRLMGSIKGRDTKPEMLVRRYLYSRGIRYRLNVKKLPGSPDIVIGRYRTVVFVDGCFWHGHEGCKHYTLPKSNTDFWRKKVVMNKARDYRVDIELRLAGWRVIRVWECELNDKAGKERFLSRIYDSIIGYGVECGDSGANSESLAAEPLVGYGYVRSHKKKK